MNDLPEIRVSDRDRMEIILQLQSAYAEGRINHLELDQRLGQANTALTRADLDALVVDLPKQVTPDRDVVNAELNRRQQLRQGWIAWIGVGVLVNIIWLSIWTTTDAGKPGYWPIWVMGPWGVAMLMASLKNGRRD
jgi:hypothetical protein